MRLLRPSFFIMGAPKCGTTSLNAYLASNPAVFMCPHKEPNFFNQNVSNPHTTLEQYLSYFSSVPDSAVASGEASVLYLQSPVAASNILAFEPKARFIVMVRNPLDMAPSLHAHYLREGMETIDDFGVAWRAENARATGHQVPPACRNPAELLYGSMCLLGEQLSRLLEVAGSERVLPIVFDDLRERPRNVYQKVLAFLDVPDDGRQDFPRYNASVAHRSERVFRVQRWAYQTKERFGMHTGFGLIARVAKLNAVPHPWAPVSVDVRSEMVRYFRDDVAKLEALLNRELVRDWLGGE